MGTIEAAAMNLVKAVRRVYAATGAFTVNAFDEFIEAHMRPEVFEKMVEGRDVKLVRRGLSEPSEFAVDYPYQREVMIGGIKFFCLLAEAEKTKEV